MRKLILILPFLLVGLKCPDVVLPPMPSPSPTVEPSPSPSPSPTIEPTPEPTPTPAPCIGEMRAVGDYPSEMDAAIRHGIEEVGDPTGRSQLILTELLADRLRSYGHCIVTGEGDIYIRRSDRLIEEWHVVPSAGGSWTNSNNGRYLGLHTDDPGYVTCNDPKPVLHEFAIEPRQGFCRTHDITPWVHGREYCEQAGYTDGRGDCEVRPEGHPERFACEAYAVRGIDADNTGPVYTCIGCIVIPCGIAPGCACGSDGYVNTNPYAALVMGHGTLTVCNKAGSICTSAQV